MHFNGLEIAFYSVSSLQEVLQSESVYPGFVLESDDWSDCAATCTWPDGSYIALFYSETQYYSADGSLLAVVSSDE